jgi:DNA-binding response OmpR family regulator
VLAILSAFQGARAAARAAPVTLVTEGPERFPQPGSMMRVLVVDDDRDTTEALGLLLRAKGFAVELANSLSEARRHRGEAFDVVVADLGLPDGNGLEVLRELDAGEQTRGIALTGFGSADDRERSLEAGFAVHLTKPVRIETLLAVLGSAAAT